MNLRIVPVAADAKVLPEIQKLNTSAFPDIERRPLDPLLNDATGHSKVLAFFDGALFCGFACLLDTKKLSHIIYFAIEPTLRGRGYGSAALKAMCGMEAGKPVLVDIEDENEAAPNNEQRRRRKAFYVRSGFHETEVRYRWRDEDYVILSSAGTVTTRDFHEFWEEIYSASEDLRIY